MVALGSPPLTVMTRGVNATVVVAAVAWLGMAAGEVAARRLAATGRASRWRPWHLRLIGVGAGLGVLGAVIGTHDGSDGPPIIAAWAFLGAVFVVAGCIAGVVVAIGVRLWRRNPMDAEPTRRFVFAGTLAGVAVMSVVFLSAGYVAGWWVDQYACAEFGCHLFEDQATLLLGVGFGLAALAGLAATCGRSRPARPSRPLRRDPLVVVLLVLAPVLVGAAAIGIAAPGSPTYGTYEGEAGG